MVDFRRMINIVENMTESYSEDNGYLLRYLKDPRFDPHAHWYEVCEWIFNHDYLNLIQNEVKKVSPEIKIKNLDDLVDIDPEYFDVLPKEVQKECAKDVIESLMSDNPSEAPTWAYMDLRNKQLLPRNTWLIHYTDKPWQIAKEVWKVWTPCRDVPKFGHSCLSLW